MAAAQPTPEDCVRVIPGEVPVVQFSPLIHLAANLGRGRFHYSRQGTWGAGFYLACRDDGPSAAMYGQGMLEGTLIPGRTFDATVPAALQAFLDWAGVSTRTPWYPPKRFTLEANAFRQTFGIDTVVFLPDEWCRLTKRSALWYLTGPPPDLLPRGVMPGSPRVAGVLGGVAERFEEDLPGNPAFYRSMSGSYYALPPGGGQLILG